MVLIAAFTPTEYGPIGPDEDDDDSGGADADNGACESFADLIPKVDAS